MARKLIVAAVTALAVGSDCGPSRRRSQEPSGTSGVPATVVQSTTYHVDRGAPSGCDDSGPGTAGLPWCTIARATAALRPGDRVIVGRGTYRESVTPPSGQPGAWVGYVGKEGALLDGSGVAGAAFDLHDVSFVRISGFEVTGYRKPLPAGKTVSIRGDSHHVELTHLHVHHNWNGIIIQDSAHDVAVADSEVHHCAYGVGFEGAARDVRVVRVITHHNSELLVGPATHRTYPNGDGFSADSGTSGISITDSRADDNQDGVFDLASRTASCERCAARGNRYGFRLWQGETGALVNCLAFGNTAFPVQIGSNRGSGTKRIVGCTLVGTPDDGGFAVEVAGVARLFLRNTIFAGFRLGVFTASPASLDEDHDLFHAPGRPVGLTVGEHSLLADPRFAGAHTGDFRLASDSPAIDNGVAVPGFDADLDREPRPLGAAPDIGAYESPGQRSSPGGASRPERR